MPGPGGQGGAVGGLEDAARARGGEAGPAGLRERGGEGGLEDAGGGVGALCLGGDEDGGVDEAVGGAQLVQGLARLGVDLAGGAAVEDLQHRAVPLADGELAVLQAHGAAEGRLWNPDAL